MKGGTDIRMARPLGPLAKVALSGEILAQYVRVRLTVRRSDFRTALASLRGPPGNVTEPPGPVDARTLTAGLRLGRAVTRVLPLLPTDSRCLMRSLVLSSLLSRRGIPSRVVIGVRPGEGFGAHAWVELEGHPLLPPHPEQFERLVAL